MNLASRLADLAGPGEVLISERTLSALQTHVAVEEHGEVVVEGSGRPVHVYALARVSERPAK